MAYSESETEYQAKETAGEVKQAAGELQGEMKEEARRLAGEAKQRGQALFEGQRRAAADEIGGMVEALRKTARELDQEQRPSTANLVGRAAETMDRLASNLRDQDFRALYGRVEGYARQHPGLFFGGSLVAGLVMARFLKSSSENRHRGSSYASTGRGRYETGSAY
jgi:hypothetical protein